MNRRHLAAAAASLSLAALLLTNPLRGAEAQATLETTAALQADWAAVAEATDAGARVRAERCADARDADRRVPGRCSST